MKDTTILVVEDDEDIRELVEYNLTKNGYIVICRTDGESGVKSAIWKQPDLIVLDLMLPGLDGLEVCKILKSDEETRHIPIVMLTAKGEESDIVIGLELGADDYITKPFSPKVLLARIRAVLRRGTAQDPDSPENTLTLHGIHIDPNKHRVCVEDREVDLTLTEFKIIHLLANRAGWVFTRFQIVDEIRGIDHPVTDRSVDVHIASLRKKLGTFGSCIQTVRGVGYRMKE